MTGSNTGVGKEVAQILYSKNATVYVAARSEDKANISITDIKKAWPQSKGTLRFQHLDLADLSTIKESAEGITSKESKINVLFNNAGVQALNPNGPTKTTQDHEIHMGVNIIGTFLFTKLLTPTLVSTAKIEPPNTVRVVWVSSLGTEMVGEKFYGITLDYLKYWPACKPLERYGISKAGNWLHAVEFAQRFKADGVVSVPCNPGHLRSDLYRDGGTIFKAIINFFIAYPVVNGAYTELFSAFSPQITIKQSGDWVAPWGRLHPIREDLLEATKSTAEGGNGYAKVFWEWTEEQVKDFV